MDDNNPYRSPNLPPSPDKGREQVSAVQQRPQPFSESLVTVATFFQPIQAELAKSELAAEGIPAFIQGGEFASMAWHLTVANRGVKVQVPKERAERALEILSQKPSADAITTEADDDGEGEALHELTAREQDADRAFRGAVIGLLFIPLQLYVFWLLIKVFVSDQPLAKRWRNKAVLAAVINLSSMALLCLLARSLFHH
jgi:hypothetical protein